MRLLIPKGSIETGKDVINIIQLYYGVLETSTWWADIVADRNKHYDVVINGNEGRTGFYYDYEKYRTKKYDKVFSTDKIFIGVLNGKS